MPALTAAWLHVDNVLCPCSRMCITVLYQKPQSHSCEESSVTLLRGMLFTPINREPAYVFSMISKGRKKIRLKVVVKVFYILMHSLHYGKKPSMISSPLSPITPQYLPKLDLDPVLCPKPAILLFPQDLGNSGSHCLLLLSIKTREEVAGMGPSHSVCL